MPKSKQTENSQQPFSLQWNPNGYFSKLEELRQLIATNKPYVICPQETRLQSKQNTTLKEYKVLRQDYNQGLIASGGVATLIHKSCSSCSRILTKSTLQHVTVSVSIPEITKTTHNSV